MRLFLTLLFGLLPLVLAAKRLSSVIVTYPDNTPDSAIDRDMKDLVDAGGVISHQFHIIKGFSAQAPANALQTLSTQSTEYKPTIEEDGVVTAYDGPD